MFYARHHAPPSPALNGKMSADHGKVKALAGSGRPRRI
ncbi:hypothetical protein X907_2284 [Glycocaulis alkaliphilus]|uniref:Uncharacterized protein n=1 Tax=Glycocaulis alkaliphilus TaxID=1434191 RepID=A0A3T0EBS5_9PROT|nr:hypothetical protein X907_2284 [Glycocaulis alkaliphilus]